MVSISDFVREIRGEFERVTLRLNLSMTNLLTKKLDFLCEHLHLFLRECHTSAFDRLVKAFDVLEMRA